MVRKLWSSPEPGRVSTENCFKSSVPYARPGSASGIIDPVRPSSKFSVTAGSSLCWDPDSRIHSDQAFAEAFFPRGTPTVGEAPPLSVALGGMCLVGVTVDRPLEKCPHCCGC